MRKLGQHPPLGKEHNMWLTEKLWMPRQEGTPAWVLSPILNIPDGPSGVVHNPGTGLPSEYDDAFFVCIEARDAKFSQEGTRALLEKLGAKNVELVEDEI